MRIAEKREKKVARDVTCFWNPDSDFRTGSDDAGGCELTGTQ